MVEVTAETLYEPSPKRSCFATNDWASEAQRIPSMVIVRLKQPGVMEHRVRTRDFETWLNGRPRLLGKGAQEPLARTLQSLGFDRDLIREGKTVGDFVGGLNHFR